MSTPSHHFEILGDSFLLDGQPFFIHCGEIHSPRVPREYWRHRLEMARAMGLNTVCLYLFWNFHETREGHFDFSGERDVGAFCRLAQEVGLWVILRPGPYSCAEWDFGGFPSYLLKDRRMQLRCSYPGFLNPALRYLEAMAQELAALQITRGGPVFMVQVENEYGAYGNDRDYLKTLHNCLREQGFEVPFMRCDWASPDQMVPGAVGEDVVTVANFGSKASENITSLARIYPGQPRMCGEFWVGWFDWYGHPRNGADSEDGAKHEADLRWMLKNGISFSLYMFHGGTNFGFAAGANCHNGRYDPYVTSYDYFAPLDEQGRPRPTFYNFRSLLAEATGGELSPLPDLIPVVPLPRFGLPESAPFFGSHAALHREVAPLPMEHFDQQYGAILYSTELEGRAAGKAELRVKDVHDHAWIYLNGKLLGTLNRHLGESTMELAVPESGPARLEILVESMGRVNFGHDMVEDCKGITRRVEHGALTLFDWEVANFPLDDAQLERLDFEPRTEEDGRPCFHRGFFDFSESADTHLDLRGWGKGYVWINRHLLGRYWSIGPQQTLYVPGVWLKQKDNEVIVLDFFPSKKHRSLEGLSQPILDELNLPNPTQSVKNWSQEIHAF